MENSTSHAMHWSDLLTLGSLVSIVPLFLVLRRAALPVGAALLL